MAQPRRRNMKTKGRPYNTRSRSFSIPFIPRLANGHPQLPLDVGVLTVRNLGRVCHEYHFHTERYIFPIGYEITRSYLSMHHPRREAQYTCTILRGEDIDGRPGPRFRITASDDVDNPITAGTATGAWNVIVNAANRVRNRHLFHAVSGPHYFGLDLNTIRHILQELEGTNLLRDYVRQNFIEGGGGPLHTAVAVAASTNVVGASTAEASSSSTLPQLGGPPRGTMSNPSSSATVTVAENIDVEASTTLGHSSSVLLQSAGTLGGTLSPPSSSAAAIVAANIDDEGSTSREDFLSVLPQSAGGLGGTMSGPSSSVAVTVAANIDDEAGTVMGDSSSVLPESADALGGTMSNLVHQVFRNIVASKWVLGEDEDR